MLTFSGFGRIAPDGVDTIPRIWVVLDKFDVFDTLLRPIVAVFFVISRRGRRNKLVAIFPVWH